VVFARPLATGRFYGLTLTSTALTDIFGNPLVGDGVGGNFAAIFGVGNNLTYRDGQGDTVNLRLSRGGTISLTRFADGDADVIQLLNTVRRRSRLSGSVRRARPGGDGRATYTSIQGLGNFGDVFSTLTTPPFFSRSAARPRPRPDNGPILRGLSLGGRSP
jgi:hypothetical protein